MKSRIKFFLFRKNAPRLRGHQMGQDFRNFMKMNVGRLAALFEATNRTMFLLHTWMICEKCTWEGCVPNPKIVSFMPGSIIDWPRHKIGNIWRFPDRRLGDEECSQCFFTLWLHQQIRVFKPGCMPIYDVYSMRIFFDLNPSCWQQCKTTIKKFRSKPIYECREWYLLWKNKGCIC